MREKNIITVLGSGAWGTTIAALLAEKGFETNIWAREDKVVREINEKHSNSSFLKDITLPASLKASRDLPDLFNKANIVINAIPTQYIRNTLSTLGLKADRKIILSVSKGIELETFKRPSEILSEIFKKEVYVISGPNFAAEIARHKPAATVISGPSQRIRKKLQKIFSTQYFRVYENDDTIATEIAAAMKNVIAIAAGISDAMGLGYNAKAALITRGLNEIRVLGKKMGARDITFMGLSGIGDLLLTCNSELSRNYTLGKKIAEGMSPSQILSQMKQVAEGAKTSEAVSKLSRKLGIEMPITKEVYLIIYHNKEPKKALKSLMERKIRPEFRDK